MLLDNEKIWDSFWATLDGKVELFDEHNSIKILRRVSIRKF